MLPILRVNRNIRTIRRYRTILGVLIKYGFGHFVVGILRTSDDGKLLCLSDSFMAIVVV